MPKAADIINPLEDEEQVAVLEYCDIYKMPYFHVNNELWTSSWKQKARAKKLGTQSGVPDLFIFIPMGNNVVTGEPAYKMVAVEMKRRRGSTTSESQKNWGRILTQAAVPHAVCKGATEAIEFIKFAKHYYGKAYRKEQDMIRDFSEALMATLEGKQS